MKIVKILNSLRQKDGIIIENSAILKKSKPQIGDEINIRWNKLILTKIVDSAGDDIIHLVAKDKNNNSYVYYYEDGIDDYARFFRG